MIRFLAVWLGRRALRRFAQNRAVPGAATFSGAANFFDFKLGMRLLRDRRVPLKTKATALGLGLLAVFVLEMAQLPLQTLLMLLPLVGLAADAALDGIELLAGPLLVASLALPFLAPREVVEELRAESQGRVYQAVGATIK